MTRTSTFGPAYDEAADGARVRNQMNVIRDTMLSAAECGTWLTLKELELLTHYPQASISAQLRHLRKRAFGSYQVLKRWRGERWRGLWEYRLLPPLPETQHVLFEQAQGFEAQDEGAGR